MSIAFQQPNFRTSRGKTPKKLIESFFRLLWRAPLLAFKVLTLPFRIVRWLRQSMTVASGTLLVVSIASLNIIWGYPWLGIFSACFSMFFLGRILSTLMRPKLDYHLSLPRSVPVGHDLAIPIRCRNRGRFPALQFLISFDRRRPGKRKWFRRRSRVSRTHQASSPPRPISILEAGRTQSVTSSICFNERGKQYLPAIVTRSYFPFYLFQVTQLHPLNEEIAVTPRPLSRGEDEMARGFLESMGEWSHRLLSGDALDYTGSREYEVGMPVRRWDFNSWARLGKPIVREYQSPSVQQIYLILDTTLTNEQIPFDDWNPDFERLLSAAATAILDLSKRRVNLHLCVTCDENRRQQTGGFIQLDTESMLIHLADASTTNSESCDEQIETALDGVHQTPTLILSNRESDSYPYSLPRSVHWLRIQAPDQS